MTFSPTESRLGIQHLDQKSEKSNQRIDNKSLDYKYPTVQHRHLNTRSNSEKKAKLL